MEIRAGKTILVVDDYKSLRELTANMLRTFGYRVLTAANGRSALHLAMLADAPKIDLLLTDYEMPDMRGDELAREFHHTCPTAKIVLMSTSALTPGLEDLCLLLTKPFRAHELVQSVEAAFGSKRCDEAALREVERL